MNKGLFTATVSIMATVLSPAVFAQTYGPFNVDVPAGGGGIATAIGGPGAPAINATTWTLSAWIQPKAIASGVVIVAGFGDPATGPRRFLALDGGRPSLVSEAGTLTGSTRLVAGAWRPITATFDGTHARLFVDGRQVAVRRMIIAPVRSAATIAPRGAGTPFAGRIADFAMQVGALDATALNAQAKQTPDPQTVYQSGSPSWPVQVRQMYGQTAPQDAWTRPVSRAPFPAPVARPLPAAPAIAPVRPGEWTVGGWRLAEAPKVTAPGATLSRAGFDASSWYVATVPGTVLTTLVDRGVYADPAFGLNNTTIPERLARQDYWYRTEFDAPAETGDRRQTLTFNGVNYSADVWLNGQVIGTMKGAFVRGRFDVTGKLLKGRNAIAVRVSPPPHPGIAHEESLTAGVGENGGMMMLDGPTFVATEGWDWIPSVRDRNTGLWRGVTLSTTGVATLGDAQIVTTLPKADNSVADIEISVPVSNASDRVIGAVVHAAFDRVSVEKRVTLAPGQTAIVVMKPTDFPQLAVRNPKLWWPNGYGDPALHDLTLTAMVDGARSDTSHVRFGIRQVTYDISFVNAGRIPGQRGGVKAGHC